MTEQLEEVLHYYRQKSDKIEEERVEWLQQLHFMKQSIDNVHLKERELLQKKIMIAEQQKALSDSHITMFDEKIHELQLLKDNEELRKADDKDCLKIKELMSLADETKKGTDPHRVKVKDARPKNTKKESLALQKSMKATVESKETFVSKYKQSMNVCKNNKTGKIKMIFLPHDSVNQLQTQIERLKIFRQNQKKLYTQALAAYEKDKTIKQEEFRLRKIDFEHKYNQLRELVNRRNVQKEAICKDYFKMRHKIKETENPAVQAVTDKLLSTRQALEKKLEAEKAKLENEISFKVENLEKDAKDYTDKYRTQAKRKEGKVNILREQYLHLQKVYLENIKTLEYELKALLEREETFEFRRSREFATFNEDVLALKKKIILYEDYIKKLKKLVDKDKAEELIDELTKNDQKRIDLIDIREEIRKLKDEVDHSRRLKV